MLIDSSARILDFVDCSDPYGKIKVIPDLQQGGMGLSVGQGFDAGSPVKSWLIVNAGTAPVSGTVVLSDAGFRNFRMFGNVNVIDNNRALTVTNQAFIASWYQAGVTGQYLKIQIQNPVGSGKNVYVQRLQWDSAQANATASLFLVPNTAGLTNQGNAPSKMGGGQAGVTQMWSGTASTAPVQAGSLCIMWPAASLPEAQPICLPPGWGLQCYGTAPGLDGRMTAEIIEQ